VKEFLLKLVAPIAKFTAIIKQPDPDLDDSDFLTLKTLIKDGDCLVSKTSWQLTNLLMPGEWKHAAIYYKGFVYEAASQVGVRKVTLEDFFYKKDHVGLCRFADFPEDLESTPDMWLNNRIGKPYDWDLILSDNDKYYCSELCFYFYCLCFGDFAKKFKPSFYLGKEVIRPTDMWNNLAQVGRWS
jgi:uncharacterized protein YycO